MINSHGRMNRNRARIARTQMRRPQQNWTKRNNKESAASNDIHALTPNQRNVLGKTVAPAFRISRTPTLRVIQELLAELYGKALRKMKEIEGKLLLLLRHGDESREVRLSVNDFATLAAEARC